MSPDMSEQRVSVNPDMPEQRVRAQICLSKEYEPSYA